MSSRLMLGWLLSLTLLFAPWLMGQPSGTPLMGKTATDITNAFGVPGSNGSRVKPHNGVDFSAPLGTPVLATGDGVVTRVKNSTGHYGLNIKIRHNAVYESFYAHLDSAKVQVGDRVVQGQAIGSVGTSGLTAQPTLHYEIRQNGAQINPTPWLPPVLGLKSCDNGPKMCFLFIERQPLP